MYKRFYVLKEKGVILFIIVISICFSSILFIAVFLSSFIFQMNSISSKQIERNANEKFLIFKNPFPQIRGEKNKQNLPVNLQIGNR